MKLTSHLHLAPRYGAVLPLPHVFMAWYLVDPRDNFTSLPRVLPEKLMVTQLFKNFFIFYGTRKFHYCVHKSLPLDPPLRQMNPIHILTSKSQALCNVIFYFTML